MRDTHTERGEVMAMPLFDWSQFFEALVLWWSYYGWAVLASVPFLAVLFVMGRTFKVRTSDRRACERRAQFIATVQADALTRRRSEHVFTAVKSVVDISTRKAAR